MNTNSKALFGELMHEFFDSRIKEFEWKKE